MMEQAPQPTLILASASPRRRELVRYLGLPFEAVATDGEEADLAPPPDIARALPPFPFDPASHPTLLAWRKAQAAVDAGYRGLILGADTIVVVNQRILGKPRDVEDARRMLRLLAGRTHSVYTGVTLLKVGPGSQFLLDLVRSDVAMAPLSDSEIAEYVNTGEPLDKAGAYGIQGLGGRLVQSVTGSYTSVVGFPLGSMYRLLSAMGVQPVAEPAQAFARWLADQGKEMPVCTAP